MRYVTISFFLAVITAGCANKNQDYAAVKDGSKVSEQELADYCKTVKCRGPVTIQLKKQDGSTWEFKLDNAQPVVQNIGGETISIFPGEEIYIEYDEAAGGPMNFRNVTTITNPERTLIFSFSQEPNSGTMILRHENKSNRNIKFTLGMMLPDSGDIYKTSSCPMMAGLVVYESWPQPIFQLIMADFRWVKETDTECN